MNNICKQLVKFDKPPYFNNEISSVPVVLSDSKGFYLKQHLDFPNNIQWCSKRGATTVEQFNYLKRTLQILLQKYSKITVFVWLGTCDLTYKDESGFISLASKTDDVVNNIYAVYKDIYFFCRSFDNVKVIFLELPVYSIYWWNYFRRHSGPEQFREEDLLLHEQISSLNNYIRDLNRILHVHSPCFSTDLLQSRKQSARTHTFLSYTFAGYLDGIHPGPELSRLWLLRLCRIFNMYC